MVKVWDLEEAVVRLHREPRELDEDVVLDVFVTNRLRHTTRSRTPAVGLAGGQFAALAPYEPYHHGMPGFVVRDGVDVHDDGHRARRIVMGATMRISLAAFT